MTELAAGTILGYPRIGRRRELKRAVEAHWRGELEETALERVAADLRRDTRHRLADLGLGRADSAIPESFSFYDQVLDVAAAVGALPERFAHLRRADGTIPLAAYFTAARGEGDAAPLEMTKWFDTNYHYLVPEIGPETHFTLSSDRFARQVAEAVADGFTTRPVLVGPVTFLALSKTTDAAPAARPLDRLDDLLPVYVDLLAAFRDAGAEWVQLDEPALVSQSLGYTDDELAAAAARAAEVLASAERRPAILVAVGYGQLSAAAWRALAASPVDAIAVDLIRGSIPAPTAGLASKVLVAGVIDGRNVWRGDLASAADAVDQVARLGAAATVRARRRRSNMSRTTSTTRPSSIRGWSRGSHSPTRRSDRSRRSLEVSATDARRSPTRWMPRPPRSPIAVTPRACATGPCATASPP